MHGGDGGNLAVGHRDAEALGRRPAGREGVSRRSLAVDGQPICQSDANAPFGLEWIQVAPMRKWRNWQTHQT